MIYVLVAAGLCTALLGQTIDTVVIAAGVVINGLVGFIQEGKAADALASIRAMLSPTSSVRRDRTFRTVESDELVLGDVVRLRAGDRVPADLRLFEATGLRVEESALTGESVPTSKQLQQVPLEAGVGDRTNMAFSGTTVSAGTGLGVVTATAQATEIGKITAMLDDVEQVETPLTREMAQFSSRIAVLAVGLSLIVVAVNRLFYRTAVVDLLLSAIGFAVAAIPEGLPAIMSITLALGVEQMARRNAITRRMNSVETLGSVTTICSDKTGTLTRNEMTVRSVVTAHATYEVTGTGYQPDGVVLISGRPAPLEHHRDLAAAMQVASYANDSDIVREHDGTWSVQGEPTDGAITVVAIKSGVTRTGQRHSAVPFDSTYKYMASLDSVDGQKFIHLKGAPDRLLDRSSHQLNADGTVSLLDRRWWESQINQLGSKGMRVLAAAWREHEGAEKITTAEIDHGGFCFIGLYGLADPPRAEAIAAVRDVQNAGITVRMITGDHASTATAIAHEIGLATGTTITGAEIEQASDEELQEIVTHATVFARTSPEHKLRLVRAMQANGEVVSMTGDGVNDAPSLKQADVGVAMGVKGTEATKDAADIVLADDNFATIRAAVERGRTIFDNLRKAIMFMLPTNGAQGLVIFVALLAGMTLPITPLQVLWVNLITAVTLSLALSFEPSEPGIMKRPPRDPVMSLLDGTSLIRVAYVSVLVAGFSIGVFRWAEVSGTSLAECRTLAVNTLVIAHIFYLLNARFARVSSVRKELLTTNPFSWLCVASMLTLQLLLVSLPIMNTAFDTTAVAARSWGIPLAAGVVVFVIVEVDKAIRRRKMAH